MRPTRNRLRTAFLCLPVLAAVSLTDVAIAQVTSAQQNAIKQSCRSDFMSNCSGVSPGGKEALACLQTNVASLSPACQQAVNATMPAPAQSPAQAAPAPAAPAPAAAEAVPPPAPAKVVVAPAAAAPVAMQPTAAQQSAMKQSCRSDFMSHCSGVSPGGKDALVCLQRNVASLSPACRQVVSATLPAAAKTKAKMAVATPAAAAVVAPAVVATPVAGPTPQQLSAIKHTCGRDFKAHCRGVQPGGPEALACLQRNAARLAPDCKTSLADVADVAPVAAALVAAPAAVPAAAPHRPLPPGITPAGRIIRRVMERNQ